MVNNLLVLVKKNRILFIIISILYIILSLLFSINSYRKDENTLINSWNSLVVKEIWTKENLSFQKKRILKENKISGTFFSNYSNFGTIAIYFNHHDKDNKGNISFILKDSDSNEVIYQNNYPIDKINSAYPYTFGFPLIKDSKGKNYLFEIISLDGTEEESISLNSADHYLIKFVYSKDSLLSNKLLFWELLQGKFIYLFNALLSSFYSSLSLFFGVYFLIIFIISFILIFKKQLFYLFFKRLDILYPYILFFTTLFIASYFSKIGVDPHHDGIMLKPAIDVSKGLILFKETFSQYGALSVYFQAIAIKIFGEYLIVIRFLTAFFYSLISVLLYFIWKKILSKNLAFFSVLLWLAIAPFYYLTFLPWASVQALFFQLISFLLMLFSFKNNSFKRDFLLGIFIALTFWSKQNVGAYTLLAIITIAILHFKNLKKTLIFLLNNFIGFSSISLLFLILIILQGAALDWIKQSFIYALHWAKTFGKKTPFLISLFPKSKHTISLWSVLPIFTILTLLSQKVKKKMENNIPLYLSIFSLFSWVQYHPIPDPRHAFWASAPMVGLLVYYLYVNIIKNNKRKFKYLFFIIPIIFFFYHDVNYALQTSKKVISLNSETVIEDNILKGMKLTPKKVLYYQKIELEVEKSQKENQNLVTITPDALYLLFGNSHNYHPMYVNWGTISSIYPDYNNIKDKYIDNNKPIVIARDKTILPGYCKLEDLLGYDKTIIMIPCSK